MINKDLWKDKCPRYEQSEDWEHIILCNRIDQMKNEYLTELKNYLIKESNTSSSYELVEIIVEDIKTISIMKTMST